MSKMNTMRMMTILTIFLVHDLNIQNQYHFQTFKNDLP